VRRCARREHDRAQQRGVGARSAARAARARLVVAVARGGERGGVVGEAAVVAQRAAERSIARLEELGVKRIWQSLAVVTMRYSCH